MPFFKHNTNQILQLSSGAIAGNAACCCGSTGTFPTQLAVAWSGNFDPTNRILIDDGTFSNSYTVTVTQTDNNPKFTGQINVFIPTTIGGIGGGSWYVSLSGIGYFPGVIGDGFRMQSENFMSSNPNAPDDSHPIFPNMSNGFTFFSIRASIINTIVRNLGGSGSGFLCISSVDFSAHPVLTTSPSNIIHVASDSRCMFFGTQFRG